MVSFSSEAIFPLIVAMPLVGASSGLPSWLFSKSGATNCGDAVGTNVGTGVHVGGTGVQVGGAGVHVGGTGVQVGGAGVHVGGAGVHVGGAGVHVGGAGTWVGGAGTWVAGAGTWVAGASVGGIVGMVDGACGGTSVHVGDGDGVSGTSVSDRNIASFSASVIAGSAITTGLL